jgi:hypothetical protein
MQLKQSSKSLEDFDRAAGLDHDNAAVYHLRGQVQYICALLLKINAF